MNVGSETVGQCVPTNVPTTRGTTQDPVASGPLRHGHADLRKTLVWLLSRLRRFRRLFAFLNRVRKFESCRGRFRKIPAGY